MMDDDDSEKGRCLLAEYIISRIVQIFLSKEKMAIF